MLRSARNESLKTNLPVLLRALYFCLSWWKTKRKCVQVIPLADSLVISPVIFPPRSWCSFSFSSAAISPDIFGKSISQEANIDTFVQQLNQFLPGNVSSFIQQAEESPGLVPRQRLWFIDFYWLFFGMRHARKTTVRVRFVPCVTQSYIPLAFDKSKKKKNSPSKLN